MNNLTALRPILIFFIITSGVTVVFSKRLEEAGVNTTVVLIGNLIIFGSALLAYFMYNGAMKRSSGHGFVRNVYGGFVVKFFVLVTSAMFYFYFAREINKLAVFICLGLYLFYNFMISSRVVKKSKTALKHKKH